jgi:hypothetical protein
MKKLTILAFMAVSIWGCQSAPTESKSDIEIAKKVENPFEADDP